MKSRSCGDRRGRSPRSGWTAPRRVAEFGGGPRKPHPQAEATERSALQHDDSPTLLVHARGCGLPSPFRDLLPFVQTDRKEKIVLPAAPHWLPHGEGKLSTCGRHSAPGPGPRQEQQRKERRVNKPHRVVQTAIVSCDTLGKLVGANCSGWATPDWSGAQQNALIVSPLRAWACRTVMRRLRVMTSCHSLPGKYYRSPVRIRRGKRSCPS